MGVVFAADDNERVQAVPRAATPLRFVANENTEEHDTPSRHLRGAPIRERHAAVRSHDQSADTQFTTGALPDLSVLFRAAFSVPGRERCHMTPPRGGGDVSPAA